MIGKRRMGLTARAWQRGALIVLTAGTLSACDGVQMPGFLQAKADDGDAAPVAQNTTSRLVERDVEAPEIFEVREDGLWDGRPSLGGVWAAHPSVKDPERVIIRNEENGKFVIGALFRKERATPGPKLQISSDAAAALGMLAGSPTRLHVVALRREEAAESNPQNTEPRDVPSGGALDAPSTIESSDLTPVTEIASAALDDTPPAPRPAASSLAKPFIQIGIFSVEQNAKNTAEAMRQRGMVPIVKKQSSKGKTFWRVIVGPAQNKGELDALMQKIKSAGFDDAYAVTN